LINMNEIIHCSYFFQLESGWVHRLSWSPDGQWLAAPLNTGKIQLWNFREKSQTILSVFEKEIYGVTWSPDSKKLACCALNGCVSLFDIDHQKSEELPGIPAYPWFDVEWSPNGDLIACISSAGHLLIYDLAKNSPITFKQAPSPHTSASWNPNSEMLAVTHEDGTTAVNTVPNFQENHEFNSAGKTSSFCAWSQQGTFLATAHDDGIRLWNPESWTLMRHLESQENVRALSFSASGQFLSSLSQKGSMTLWRMDDWSMLARIENKTRSLWQGQAFHPKDSLIAVPDDQGSRVVFWEISEDDVKRSASENLNVHVCRNCLPRSFPDSPKTSITPTPWTLDPLESCVERNGKVVYLTNQERKAFDVLDRCYKANPEARLRGEKIETEIDGQFRYLLSGKKGKGLRSKLKPLGLEIEGGRPKSPGYRLVDIEVEG
jgi:WD40 repeat protein